MEKGRRDLARALRNRATDAERALWREMRSTLVLNGTYFRRQVSIGPFIVDFACFRHRLIVELDAGQHGAAAALRYDDMRTGERERRGFRVLRLWNYQVFTETEAVLDTIHAALNGTLLSPVERDCHSAALEVPAERFFLDPREP